jgi:hypothetical protein
MVEYKSSPTNRINFMTSIVLHNYNGFTISQDVDGYTSLTDMAKAAGKLVADYLRLESTEAYLEELGSVMGQPISSLVKVFRGGSGKQGTWAHPQVALDFAQWCNVSFRVWANCTLVSVIKGDIAPLQSAQPTHTIHDEIRKLELQVELKKLELGIYAPHPANHLQPRTVSTPIQTELDLDIVERYKASEAALLKAKTLKNEYKALSIAPKPKYDLATIENIESVEAYIRDRTKLDPNAKVYIGKADGNPDTHFYPNYVNYCVEQGMAFVAMQRFSKVLMQLVYTNMGARLFKGKDRIGCHVKGIAILA